MSDDDSNDVVMVENTGENSQESRDLLESRPIMQLFQRLISSDNKQNTVLTNQQIISILHKEFDIDVTTLHELELDIYLNIVKRFLKDWPKWDEFDQGVNALRKKNAYNKIRKTLEQKYADLKSYLKLQIERTKPFAQESVKKMIRENAKRMEKVDTSDLILEVYCTRKQLNELILSEPVSGDIENTIFNLSDYKPTSITVNKLPIESILNWFSVQVTIDAKFFSYQRTTCHQLKHVLVNSKNGFTQPKPVLNPRTQIKETKEGKKLSEDLSRSSILSNFNKLQTSKLLGNGNAIMSSLIELVKTDLNEMDTLKVLATYRQFTSKYPYYRKLRKQVDSGQSHTYDLYIEETLTPLHTFALGKTRSAKKDDVVSFSVECLECHLKFSGGNMCSLMREHFDMYHSDEPDWTCSNCERTFAMTELTRNVWRHVCSENDRENETAVLDTEISHSIP